MFTQMIQVSTSTYATLFEVIGGEGCKFPDSAKITLLQLQKMKQFLQLFPSKFVH
jgi:hypothetical protein